MRFTETTDQPWGTLRMLLQDDTDPGAVLLRENLDAIEGVVRDSDGKLIALMEARHPYRFAGAVALSMGGCGIVHMHFYYVYEEFRGRSLEILQALFRAVHAFGLKRTYGYVFANAPIGEHFQSQHDLLFPRSIERRDDTMPSGHSMTIYSIPKEQFARFCA